MPWGISLKFAPNRSVMSTQQSRVHNITQDIMSTHTVLRSVDKVISELLIESKLKGAITLNTYLMN